MENSAARRTAPALLAAALALALAIPGCAPASPEELEAKREEALAHADDVYLDPSTIVGLSSDGRAYSSGLPDDAAQQVSEWTDVVQAVSPERFVAFGLRPDGTVAIAGDDLDGLLDVSGWTGIIQLACTAGGVYGLRADGTVVATAVNDDNGRLEVGGWRDVEELYSSRGSNIMYGRTKDGALLCTDGGEQAAVSEWSDIEQFDRNRGHALALRSDGTVYSYGFDEALASQIAQWEGVVQVAACGEQGLAAGLRADGTVLFTGDPEESGGALLGRDGSVREMPPREGAYDEESLAEIAGWRDVAYIEGCNSYLLGLTADGRVLFAGRDGSRDNSSFDTSGWRDVVCVYATDPSFVALKADGTLEGYVNSPISGFPPLW